MMVKNNWAFASEVCGDDFDQKRSGPCDDKWRKQDE